MHDQTYTRGNNKDVVHDTPEVRRKGWKRAVQFGAFFVPSQIEVVPFNCAWKDAIQMYPNMKR
jgi:hypothetical protein